MPELAEVEAVRLQIEKRFKNKKITEVVVDDTDPYLYEFVKAQDFKKALTGATIKGTGRKGKYFWIELNRKPWPMIHLGMTGNIAIIDPSAKSEGEGRLWDGIRLKSRHDEDLRKRMHFCHLIIKSGKKIELALIDPRRFGRLWLTDDPWQNPRIKKLGYDPLLEFPPIKVFTEKLRKRKKAIKAVFLDQSLFAGIGNWLADEILYQARLSPHHLALNLKSAQILALHKSILYVIRKAVATNADYERFPKSWLFHHRWGKLKDAKTSDGKKIVHEEVGGRTTAWVPGWQK